MHHLHLAAFFWGMFIGSGLTLTILFMYAMCEIAAACDNEKEQLNARKQYPQNYWI